MGLVADLINVIDARIAQKSVERTVIGTVVARTSATDALVVMDGSQGSVPVKVAGNAPAHEGDRVYLVKFGRWWTVVGAGLNRGTQERIQEVIVPSATSTITFANISQDYTHLRLVGICRGDAVLGTVNLTLRFNGDTSARYSMMSTDSANTVATPGVFVSAAQTVLTWGFAIPGSTILAETRAGCDMTIWDYASTAWAAKQTYSVSGFTDFGTTVEMRHRWGAWDPTVAQAITNIDVIAASGNIVAGSRLALWGIV